MEQVLQYIKDGGTLTLAVGFFYLQYRKIIRWGWECEECCKKAQTLQVAMDEINKARDAKLERLEAELADIRNRAH